MSEGKVTDMEDDEEEEQGQQFIRDRTFSATSTASMSAISTDSPIHLSRGGDMGFEETNALDEIMEEGRNTSLFTSLDLT